MNAIQKKVSALIFNKQLRIDEIFAYQLNIDNYTLAIKNIDESTPEFKAEMSDFRAQLQNLLVSEIHQQNRTKLLLKVCEDQLATLPPLKFSLRVFIAKTIIAACSVLPSKSGIYRP